MQGTLLIAPVEGEAGSGKNQRFRTDWRMLVETFGAKIVRTMKLIRESLKSVPAGLSTINEFCDSFGSSPSSSMSIAVLSVFVSS